MIIGLAVNVVEKNLLNQRIDQPLTDAQRS